MAENTEEPKLKSEIAQKEERILQFWQENKIFEKTLVQTEGKEEFVFYEGPPTANGRPAIHHLEARAFKDALPRYKTMRGYHVRRKAGWDTHGLPVELEVEKELGLKSKKEIEEYGIASFNQKCKESVWKYLSEWQKFTDRIGYWVDQENPYVTYYPEYIETVWWTVKQISDKGLLYKDYKVLPWCPRCGTALSSHELAQGYKDVKDLSVYAKFKIVGFENAFFLAWTTTPWTLPGNVALAVGNDIDYVEAKVGNEILVLAKERLSILSEPYEVIAEHKGSEMVGMQYEPLYPFLKDSISGPEKEKLSSAYKIYPASFVTTTDGSGIVHTAVMYGADDFELGTKVGLPKYHLVNDNGTFKSEAGFLAGLFVKDEATAVEIIKDLAHRGLLYKKEKFEHSYPHCWRCKTPLIYFARDSWYIKMSSLRNDLIAENNKINWEPEHIKEGRFGEWIKEVKDWAISRERYWGTPLPVWNCESCKEQKFIGSIEELKSRTKKSGNKYFVMRHGESMYNLDGLISNDKDAPDHLTEKGKDQVRKSAEELKGKGIDLIVASPFVRTRETLVIVKEILGLEDNQIVIDDRLGEMIVGEFSGTTWLEYHNLIPKNEETFSQALPNGESYMKVKHRTMETLSDIENTYKNRNVLYVTHGAPAWLVFAGAQGLTSKETLSMVHAKGSFQYLGNAEVWELSYIPLPHNENYELDLHRPYIDEYPVICNCGGDMKRAKEVMDVWFDSGAMPLAQEHYPFENKEKLLYPADFISEAIDQTRGWFYTLLAVGVLLGKGAPYKNVICLGHLLDKDGKKMSKSIGNVVNAWDMMDIYGADALRFWMYSVNQPGESKNFDEKTVDEMIKKVFNLLYNVLSFYELYRDVSIEQGEYNEKPANILDQWIVARLNVLIKEMTEDLDAYNLLNPTRAIRDFIDDLSTWYLRRSRDRIKDGDVEAKRTLYFVLKTLAKLMAPFAPFTAEDIWQKLKVEQNKESIHLTNWPEVKEFSAEVIAEMESVRKIVSLGLEARQKAGLKVRQPLQKIKVHTLAIREESFESVKKEYAELIKDELNVKEVEIAALKDGARHDSAESEAQGVELDTNITEELKMEGDYRELLRSVQDMRKKEGLMPNDKINLIIETDSVGQNLIQKFEADLKKSAGISNINFESNDGAGIKIDNISFKLIVSK